MAKQRIISILAFCATFFALGVIALGAFTRLIDAGLGCPDWPGCYGHIAVPLVENPHMVAYKAWAEMVHRYFVGGLSLFILSVVIVIFRFHKVLRSKANLILACGLILLLIYQIMLGRWTVTLKLLPIVVTQHLLGGFLILSILWLIYLNNSSQSKSVANGAQIKKLFPWSLIALVILLLQITLGAWTSTNYASLSCQDFPFCVNDNPFMPLYLKQAFNLFAPIGVNYEGGVLPEAVRQTIQMVHRIGALIFTLYIFILMIVAMPRIKQCTNLLKSMYLIIGLVCLQLSIGISNVIFKLPLVTAISHNLVAVILLLAVITFTFKLAHIDSKASRL